MFGEISFEENLTSKCSMEFNQIQQYEYEIKNIQGVPWGIKIKQHLS